MKLVISYCLILLFPMFLGCITQKVTTVKIKAISGKLTNEIDSLSKVNNFFEGLATAIVDENGILYENSFGYADKKLNRKYDINTVQNIGSISKTFIGISLLKAQELGKLKLDDSIDKYLPFHVRNNSFPNSPITIRQLANHTSSIADNWNYYTKDYFLKPSQDLSEVNYPTNGIVLNPPDSALNLELLLKNLLDTNGKWRTKESFTNSKPGTKYQYSNTGATLAAFIVQQATGISFDSFTKQHILNPLKMKASGWKFDDIDFNKHSKMYVAPGKVLPYYAMSSYPDGNFITNVHDLSIYLQELIRAYKGKGTLLNNDSYKELFRQQLTAENFTSRDEKNPYNDDYNMGIFMASTPSGKIGHSGSDPGVVSLMFFNPKTNTGGILIVNTSFSGKDSKSTFYKIFDILENYQPQLQGYKGN